MWHISPTETFQSYWGFNRSCSQHSKHSSCRLQLLSKRLLLLLWHFRVPLLRTRVLKVTWFMTNVTLPLIRLCSKKFWTISSEMGSSALKTLHSPLSIRLRSSVGFLLSFLSFFTAMMCLHNPTWVHLKLFHYLCLLQQDWELPNPHGYYNIHQFVTQSPFELPAPPLLAHILRVELS